MNKNNDIDNTANIDLLYYAKHYLKSLKVCNSFCQILLGESQ
jgi:hypothetical protein